MTKKICMTCGLPFERLSKAQRYCPPCGEAREAEYMREYRRRYAHTRRPRWHAVEASCPFCGVVFKPTGSRYRYCPACAGLGPLQFEILGTFMRAKERMRAETGLTREGNEYRRRATIFPEAASGGRSERDIKLRVSAIGLIRASR